MRRHSNNMQSQPLQTSAQKYRIIFSRFGPNLVNMAQNKTKKVLMKTSHCDTPNSRLSYAKVCNLVIKNKTKILYRQ